MAQLCACLNSCLILMQSKISGFALMCKKNDDDELDGQKQVILV